MLLQKESILRLKETVLLVFLVLFLFSLSGKSPAPPDAKHSNKHQQAQLVKNKLAVVSRLQVSLSQPAFQKIPALLQRTTFSPDTRITPVLRAACSYTPQPTAQSSCRLYYRLFSLSGEEPA